METCIVQDVIKNNFLFFRFVFIKNGVSTDYHLSFHVKIINQKNYLHFIETSDIWLK